MAVKKVKTNRAPVLTLWAAVVAERLGYAEDTALTLGKAVAGLNAQSKGKRLGIYPESKPESKDDDQADAKAEKKAAASQSMVSVLGRPVPAEETKEGLRATTKGEPISPDSVRRYLKGKFGDSLSDVEAAMKALARAYRPKQLDKQAYDLYEKFRPEIPEGKKGWGAQGELDLDYIRSLAKK